MVIFQFNLYIFGIHLWTVLYPKPCYKEPCYKEVVVYICMQKVSRSIVFDWHRCFREERGDIKDNVQSGRSENADIVKRVENFVLLGRWKSCSMHQDLVTKLHKIITQELEMGKVCARWVPQQLSAENIQKRVEISEVPATLEKIWPPNFKQDLDDWWDLDKLYDLETKRVTDVEAWILTTS